MLFVFESFVLYKWGVEFMSNYHICGDVSIISADDSVVDDDDDKHLNTRFMMFIMNS